MFQKALSLAVLTASFFLTVGHAAVQQPATAAVEVDRLGPQVGARVPEFSLPDQHGESRSLTSLMGPKGAILVFFRSADW